MNVERVSNRKRFNFTIPKVSVQKLREAFVKVAPRIDSNLISDALKSFGDDNTEIEESVFLTTFNPKFDEECNQTIPNSKNNPGASFKSKKGRPATASSTVVLSESASTSLIRKLDNAMLRQKLSLLDAFKQADLNQNGVITVDELKLAIKNLLPADTLSPADFKMTMKAFDANRNGQIDEDEFIKCITMARENAPPSTPDNLGMMESKGFNGTDSMLSSITKNNRNGDSDEVPVDMLLLRIILCSMKENQGQINELKDHSMSILDRYWDKNDEPVDELEF